VAALASGTSLHMIHNCTLKLPEPTLGTSAYFARAVIRGRRSGKHEEYWQSIH